MLWDDGCEPLMICAGRDPDIVSHPRKAHGITTKIGMGIDRLSMERMIEIISRN
ncbi:hypothetical protein RBSWK_01496 [Rhodopirellula baltica SWK14]|uniref:Uncharacterized protein n=1 Tax=Rhodopirellula baltica SWK14 TaxID=993516 RepID=L7CLV4_RHOBT|nr:hypothetical protein RBSWK_01496 [Rhodopirellula baltica SWK14]